MHLLLGTDVRASVLVHKSIAHLPFVHEAL